MEIPVKERSKQPCGGDRSNDQDEPSECCDERRDTVVGEAAVKRLCRKLNYDLEITPESSPGPELASEWPG